MLAGVCDEVAFFTITLFISYVIDTNQHSNRRYDQSLIVITHLCMLQESGFLMTTYLYYFFISKHLQTESDLSII